MKYVAMLLFGTIGMSSALAAASLDRPPLPAARPVSEVLFGTTVTDPYRYFEAQDAAVTDWMKAEGRYTRSLIDSRPGRAETLKRISQITGSFDVVNQIQSAGGRTFYQQRSVGSDNFDLMVRNRDGSTRKLVDVGAIRAAHGGTPIAINYYQPSNDGTKAAVGISEGGSEDASLYVYDTSNGVQIAEPVPKAEFGAISWAPDDQSLFVVLLNVLKSGEPEINKYKNAKVHVWDLKSKPVPVLGAGITPAVQFTPEEIPVVATFSGSPIAMALNINGVQNEWEIWTAPVNSAERADAPWKKLASRDAGVTSVAVAGDRIFLLSHKGSPTFQVLRLKAGEPLAAAKVVVAARPDRLIESVSAAADGLYVRARRGVYSELFKVPLDGGPEQQIALPVKGSITELSADPRSPGATVIVGSWAVPQTALTYDPAQQKFANLGLGNPPKGFDPALFAVSDLMVKAKDGVEVPLSLVSATASKHPRPVLLWAYGSYGSSQYPGFGTRAIATLTNGIDYAVCHVRGGGSLARPGALPARMRISRTPGGILLPAAKT